MNEDILEHLIEFMPGNVFWKDFKGRFLGCNKNLLNFFGLKSVYEIKGKTDYDFVPKKLAKYIREIESNIIETNNPLSFEMLGVGRDGSERCYVTHTAPLCNKESKVIAILGISFDVTEQKGKEKKLQRAKKQAEAIPKIAAKFLSQLNKEVTGQKSYKERTIEEYALNVRNYLENIIDLMPGNIYWLNTEGIFLGCNNHQLQRLGINSRYDYIGKTYEDLLDKDNAKITRETDKQIMESDTPRTLEEIGLDIRGNKAIYITSKVPLHDEKGKVIGLLGVSIDITESKRLEKELQEAKIREQTQQEKIKALQGAVASIAHEIRTPLSAIKSTASGVNQYLADFITTYKIARDAELKVPFIRQDQLTDLEEGFKKLNREAELAQDVISMFLTNIKMLEGGIGKLTVCSMVECINDALCRYTFAPREQADLVHWQKTSDFEFNGEPLLMNHVLFNLLKNALYYVEKAGKGEINIWLVKKRNHNELHFKDTGQGIMPEDLPHIFEQFYSRTPNGTGIGLAFCKMAMQNFDGDITCKSVYGEFAEFILRFPKLKNYML